MPTPRPIKDYPKEYFILFVRVLAGERVVLDLGAIEAKRFRMHLYSFRHALQTEPSFFPELSEYIHQVKLRLSDATLIVEKRSDDFPNVHIKLPKSFRQYNVNNWSSLSN